jgi:hypothetical protein
MTDLRTPSLVLNCIEGRETAAPARRPVAEWNSVWLSGKKNLP